MIVFAAMYRALTVAFQCCHRDHSVTYVWCAIVSLVWIPFALTLYICKMRCIRMVKTLLVQKADAMVRVVCLTFALTLFVWKKFALTFCVCKTRAAFRRQMP